MKYIQWSLFKSVGFLLIGSFFLLGCLEEGDKITNPIEPQLVVVPSATEVSVGDKVTFDILLLGEIVEADLFIEGNKISGIDHVFNTSGTYSVVAKKQGANESAAVQIIVSTGNSSEGTIQVYIAGYEDNGSNNVAKYWKNDAANEISLSDGTISQQANGIYVYQGDVYVAGTVWDYSGDNTFAVKYWKNNASGVHILYRGRGEGLDISVYQGDVYVAGAIDLGAVYWKNGNPEVLTDTSDSVNWGDKRLVSGMMISNGNVYLSGGNGTKDPPSDANAMYWKNNGANVTPLPGSGTGTLATSIAVDKQGNVYVSGASLNNNSGYNRWAVYWKNGNMTTLPVSEGEYSIANSIAVTGNGDIYAAGFYRNGSGDSYAVLWKNGTMIKLNSSSEEAVATDIALAPNGNIYVSGITDTDSSESKAVYWMSDGTDNFTKVSLTDGTYEAEATSIYVAVE